MESGFLGVWSLEFGVWIPWSLEFGRLSPPAPIPEHAELITENDQESLLDAKGQCAMREDKTLANFQIGMLHVTH
jgi:hypothetical protein